MADKPFYLRSHFWVTLALMAPGIATAVADAINHALSSGMLDPNDPLYALFVKVAALAGSVYVVVNGGKYAAQLYGAAKSGSALV